MCDTDRRDAAAKGRRGCVGQESFEMGMTPPPRQGEAADRPIAAFDFDGTITIKDSYGDFLMWRTKPLARLLAGAALLPAALAYLLNRDRGAMKAAATRAFLEGTPIQTLAEEARAFAAARFDSLVRPSALETWRRLGAQGMERVIVTASPEVVVAPFAQRLGADRLIATRLRTDAQGRITGELDGANCRGPEKVRRLVEAYGPRLEVRCAFGDTSGDVEMLAMARDPGFRVFTDRP